MNTRRLIVAVSLLTIHALTIPRSVAANVDWIGPSGIGANWNVDANWSTGLVPVTPDVALINNGGVALIDSTMSLNPGSVTLGSTAGTSGTVQMSGGTLTLSNTDLRIGGNSTTVAGGTGIFTQSGGNVILNAGNVNVGFNAVGSYEISGGSFTLNSSNIFAVGNRGTGGVTQSGGTIYVRGNSGGTGTGFAAAVFQLGRNTATVPASGSYTLSGGTLAATNFRFGQAVGTAGVSNNTFNLQGTGELIARDFSIVNTFATNTFNFTGGTLRAQTIGLSVTNTGGILSPSNPLFNGIGDISQLVIDPISTTTFALDYGYTQSGNGRLSLDLRDALQYDILDVGGNGNGTITLGGFVDVNSLSGFDPGLGIFFDVAKADALAFTGQIVGQTPSGNLFEPSVVTGGDGRQVLRLTVVPEPASIALFGTAALVAAAFRRRRSFE